MIDLHTWIKDFNGAITVCDIDGIILSMNEKSCKTFADSGGSSLAGTNLMACHPEKAQARIRELIEKEETNVYTIEKKGKKKLIYQAPWYKDGICGGLVELSLEIPHNIPHFVRE